MPQCIDGMMFSCTDAGVVLSIVLGFCLVLFCVAALVMIFREMFGEGSK